MALVYKCSSATGIKYLPSLLKYGHCPLLKCPAALLPVMPWSGKDFKPSHFNNQARNLKKKSEFKELFFPSSISHQHESPPSSGKVPAAFLFLLHLVSFWTSSLHLHLPGPLPQQPAPLSAVIPKQPIPSPCSPTPAPISLECQRHCAMFCANLLPPFCCQLPLPGILVWA